MPDLMRTLNRLAKWRTFFAGWQLGTRSKGDPECDAVREAAEARLIMRVELSGMAALLIQKGVCSQEEWDRAVELEAKAMNRMLEDRFPGVQATDEGLVITNPEGVETIRRMNFKP